MAIEWTLYRSGERIGKLIRLAGDVTKDRAKAAEHDDAARLIELLRDFLGWQPITPSTPPCAGRYACAALPSAT